MTSIQLPPRILARTSVAVMVGVIAVAAVAACDDDAATRELTTTASTTTRTASPIVRTAPTPPAEPTVTDDGSIGAAQALLDEWIADGRGGVAVALATDDTSMEVLSAGNDGPAAEPIEPDAAFRVGSLSKTFVAVMVLQLVADGTLGLDDLVTEHAPALTIAERVTIRQLLAHRSGITEHTDGELAPAVFADPGRSWGPDDVIDLVADQPRDFEPGAQFAYSNTNYIVAGMLLEQVTGMPLADNLESRIVGPLGLTSTYFAPDDTRRPIGAFSASLPAGDTDGASYRALETAAGAAGALVSTAPDLAVFVRALARGELLPSDVYAEMTKGLPADGQTLGIFPADPPTVTGISNGGAIPGYLSFMQYDPTTDDLMVLLVNDDTRSPEPLGSGLAALIASAP